MNRMTPRLRIYYGPEDCNPVSPQDPLAAPVKETVTLSVGELFPLLADAIRSERTWLRDFTDDEISISADLYEVILAYRHHIRPGA